MDKKKIVVIFGAGATTAFINDLHTDYITEQILDIENWRVVIENIKNKINNKKGESESD